MAMIAYEELVAGLTQWRMRQGLPTSQSDYLGGPRDIDLGTSAGAAQYGDQTGEVNASDLEVLDEGDAYAYEAGATDMHVPLEAGEYGSEGLAPPPVPTQGDYASYGDDQGTYAYGDEQSGGYSVEAEAPEPDSPFDASGFDEPSAPPAEYQDAGAYEEAPAFEAPAAYDEAPAAYDEAPAAYDEAPAYAEDAPAYAEAPAFDEPPAFDDDAFAAAPAFDDPAVDAAPMEAYGEDEATVIGDALPSEPAYEPPPLADAGDADYGTVDLEAEPADDVSSMVIDESDDPFGEPPPLAPPPDDDESR